LQSPISNPQSLVQQSAFRARHSIYRGRIAPSPTGLLHLGHARTFWTAYERARAASGELVFRNEDLDPARSKEQFVTAMFEDLRWFGLRWAEGPDVGGPFAPYTQSERGSFYLDALRKLAEGGFIYPCTCSRQEIERAAQAPHQGDEEPIYPGTCRAKDQTAWKTLLNSLEIPARGDSPVTHHASRPPNWRFRAPDGDTISFIDGHFGPQEFVAGRYFGDFVIWRHDDVPAYQLAVVVDDAAMNITEVVRGADLLVSTARQLLLYRALRLQPPLFFHCPLVMDEAGVRLAKRHNPLSLRALRERGFTPQILHPAA
jgi:glutamyl-tRNA synthetase